MLLAERLSQAKARFERAMAAARKQYLDDLDEAVKKATKAGQLDDAVRIRELRSLASR